MGHVGEERSRQREQQMPTSEVGQSLVGSRKRKDFGMTGVEYNRTPEAFVKGREAFTLKYEIIGGFWLLW